MVRRYIKEANLFTNNALNKINTWELKNYEKVVNNFVQI
jgi:hypothetical protein